MIINRFNIFNGGNHKMLAVSGFRADGRSTGMSWELRGQVMLTSAFQPWVILANEVNPCGPQTRARLITCWDEDWLGGNPIGTKGTSIVTKKFLYVGMCIKRSWSRRWGSDSIDPLRLLSLLFFFTIKSFFNSCSGPLDFFYTLS